jgi:hypothetical protein
MLKKTQAAGFLFYPIANAGGWRKNIFSIANVEKVLDIHRKIKLR